MHSITIPDIKINEFMVKVIARNPAEAEFHQAVKEVTDSLLSLTLCQYYDRPEFGLI